MSEVFGRAYTHAYDLLYRDKDYEGECDLIERLFKNYSEISVRDVLDLGCGTGNHAIALSRRGYTVAGVDRSEAMLEEAREKLRRIGQPNTGDIEFFCADVRELALERKFDACLMMFAVLGYQIENADVLASFRTARRHLRAGGLFIFDAWYGPAVLAERPSERVKVIPFERGQILRAAEAVLDTRRHLCTVRYKVWRLEEAAPVEYTEEEHAMRYFFPMEIENLLDSTGFEMLRLAAFPKFENEPDETTWNVICAARAR